MLKNDRHTPEFSAADISSRGIDVEWAGELLLPLEDSFNLHSNCLHTRPNEHYQVHTFHVCKNSGRK